jgi:hypothetical protein
MRNTPMNIFLLQGPVILLVLVSVGCGNSQGAAGPDGGPAADARHSLTLRIQGHGIGRRDDTGQTCRVGCAWTFADTDTPSVALSAYPDTDWQVGGWTGNPVGSCDSSTSMITVRVDQPIECTLLFTALPVDAPVDAPEPVDASAD